MCGIFGWFRPGRPVDREAAMKATNLMRHRGPDDEGYLLCNLAGGTGSLAAGPESCPRLGLPDCRDKSVQPGADLVFGFRRLSIHDLTEAGHQPMGTPDGKLWIVFNGEVYNFPEIRSELEAAGIAFHSGTDTEVILRAYERWGAACLQRFNGMWGLAILDLRRPGEPEVFLSRDRCGVKPLFIFEQDGQLAFASELKGLMPVKEGRMRANPLVLADFIAWGRYPGAREGLTFAEGIRMLPPGCSALWRGGRLEVTRWWDLGPDGDGSDLAEEEAVERLRFLLEDAIRLRLRADVPLGSCLSGGLDSSVIVGNVHRLMGMTGGRQRTFSAVYDQEGSFNEKKFIDRVLSGIPAEGFYCKPSPGQFAADFRQLVWHQDEPFTTTSIFAQWCVMKLVRESGTTVLLDGQAADELLAGYRPYRWHFADLLRAGRLREAISEAGMIRRETGDSPLRAMAAAIPSAVLPSGLVTDVVRAGYVRALRLRGKPLLLPHLMSDLASYVSESDGMASYPWRRTAESLDQHLRGLTLDYILPGLLRFEDRNSMAHSVEARVPFTDFRVVEYAFSPAMRGLKLKNGWAKWALRKAGAGVVPDDILWRRDKVGFATPESSLVCALRDSSGGMDLEALNASGMTSPEGVKNAMRVIGPESGREQLLTAFRLMVADCWISQFLS